MFWRWYSEVLFDWNPEEYPKEGPIPVFRWDEEEEGRKHREAKEALEKWEERTESEARLSQEEVQTQHKFEFLEKIKRQDRELEFYTHLLNQTDEPTVREENRFNLLRSSLRRAIASLNNRIRQRVPYEPPPSFGSPSPRYVAARASSGYQTRLHYIKEVTGMVDAWVEVHGLPPQGLVEVSSSKLPTLAPFIQSYH